MKEITISSDPSKLNIHLIHQFLTNSYWAKGRSLKQVKKSLNNSRCYGMYKAGKQIGFARVISDRVVFAYIMDVFIIEEERGNGYAHCLINHILQDKVHREIRQWLLKTRDAHPLYAKSSFAVLHNPEIFMELLINQD